MLLLPQEDLNGKICFHLIQLEKKEHEGGSLLCLAQSVEKSKTA